jgi:bacterioferritin-associated ferredoxin
LGAVVIVCSCNVLSDAKIRASIQGETGARTPGAVYSCLGCSPNCGRCFATVQSMIVEALGEARDRGDGSSACGVMTTLP